MWRQVGDDQFLIQPKAESGQAGVDQVVDILAASDARIEAHLRKQVAVEDHVTTEGYRRGNETARNGLQRPGSFVHDGGFVQINIPRV